jgi:hypothetical protein
MEKISSFGVMGVVQVQEQPVEVRLAIREAFAQLLPLLVDLALEGLLEVHAPDVAQQVPRFEFQRHDHVHAVDGGVVVLDLAGDEGGCDQILDEGVGLGQEGGEIHLLPAVALLGLDSRVSQRLEFAALEEVDEAVWLEWEYFQVFGRSEWDAN